MFLRELHVEHVRAIRRASLRLDTSTTLIGENDSGKGSLFRALHLALGTGSGACLTTSDFHHRPGASTPAGPIRVALVFEERSAGEWSSACHAPLRASVPGVPSGLRRLVIEASAAPGEAPAGLRFAVPAVSGEAAQEALIAHVRATTPLIRLSGGLLTGHASTRTLAAPTAAAIADVPDEIMALVRRVLASADELLGGTAGDPESCIEAGAHAARELLARSPRHFDPTDGTLSRALVEILGGEPERVAPVRNAHHPAAPALADRLGTLLLLAAILRQLPQGLPLGVEPLWVIEEPEAHLHPMTLASAERTLQRIRWQKIVTTQSGDLLSAVPLAQVRRLVRHEGQVRAAGVRPRALSREQLRRIGYHLRVHRGVAMFARVWLLVEGESEFWVLPQVAQVMGHDLALEGICCVSFAQCGLDPLVRAAREFAIEWHLLADGDDAGRHYADAARAFVRRGEEPDRITLLPDRDIEHCFWRHGHAVTFLDVAGLDPSLRTRTKPTAAIAKAVQRHSKPFLALRLVEAVARQGPAGVPRPLAALVERCVRLAREAPRRALLSSPE